MKMTEIDRAVSVSEGAGSAKATAIRERKTNRTRFLVTWSRAIRSPPWAMNSMRWRRHERAGRKPRPRVRTLSDEEKKKLLAGMTQEIAASPVLTGLGLQVRSLRGRFYLERPIGEGASAGVLAWGRITPLADSNDLILEHERRRGSWSEYARGSVDTLIRAVAGDTQGTFHGLGFLDQALRRAGRGLERLPVEWDGKFRFVYAEGGETCSVQEALFHYFGLPMDVIIEPSAWYAYHRKPTIFEANEEKSRVLVRFRAMSWSGENFGGTCLYALRNGKWRAYRIRPSESQNLATSEAWLERRRWRDWGS